MSSAKGLYAGWSAPDIPFAVQSETEGPGDDFGIELVESLVAVEVQAKHGLRADKRLWDAIRLFADRWDAAPDTLGVLIVDSDSSRTIRHELKLGLKRLRQNRDDHQTEIITLKVREMLGDRTVHLFVAEVDIDTDSRDPDMAPVDLEAAR